MTKRKFFKGIEDNKTGFKIRTDFFKDEVGNIPSNRQTILARWAMYFKGMLNMEEDIL
jgi:hypothetical protein